MIVGLGIDLVELSRIRRSLNRFGVSFVHKLLHPSEFPSLWEEELQDLPKERFTERLTPFIAARFAAKEAGAKALGTGFSGGIGLRDIRVHSLDSGRPVISFHGPAREAALALNVASAHLSLTHAKETAGAVVVLEAEPSGQSSLLT